MNKKAAVFHLLMYVVVLAVGIVMFFSGINLIDFEAKGQSQYEFLRNVDFNSQLKIIQEQQKIKGFINTQFTSLISNAGFVVSDANEDLNGAPYWHKVSIPDIKAELLKKVESKYKEDYEIKVKKDFTFKAKQIKIEEVNQRGYYYSYEHSPQFKVNIEHLLYEFAVVYDLSRQMYNTCQGKNNLDQCIDTQNQEKTYTLTTCEDNTKELKRTFCVNSQYLKTNYRFSLDFTPE
jgi:hypothetical protein